MRNRLLVLLLAATAACSNFPASGAEGQATALVQGTSYGMCVGYCWAELVIEPRIARFTQTSRDGVRYPTKTRIMAITEADWQRLQSLAEPTSMSQVEGTHGCPDCADGGAEWVELRTRELRIRATFDAGRDLAPIAALQAELRAIRKRFE